MSDIESKINGINDSLDRLQRTTDSVTNNFERVNTVLNRFKREQRNNNNLNSSNSNNVRIFSRMQNRRDESEESGDDDDDEDDILFYADSNSDEIDLPENTLNDISKLDNENKKCVICLEEFKDEDVVTNLQCLHIFHSSCLKKWIKYKKICPICRLRIN